jgi:DNA-binding GntR family transcriptional regulator
MLGRLERCLLGTSRSGKQLTTISIPMTKLQELPRLPNLTELAYSSIKKSVLNGHFEPSFRLTEELLSSQLGISKSPVREALNRLENEGLIRIESRRGAFVRDFSAKEITDLFDLRVVLEIHSVSNAKITPKFLQCLRDSIERTETKLAKGDRMAHVEEDMRFHRLIAEATGNEELCGVFENIQQKSLLCRYKSYELSATSSPLAHQRIYAALAASDREKARAAMEDHIVYVKSRLLQAVEKKAPQAAFQQTY